MRVCFRALYIYILFGIVAYNDCVLGSCCGVQQCKALNMQATSEYKQLQLMTEAKFNRDLIMQY